jgi:hypothetical protein
LQTGSSYFESSVLRGLMLAALAGSLVFPQSQADVFVSFDHIARPTADRRDIDSDLLFLRLRNNSRAPIQVFATPAESGAEGVEVVHEIIETPGASKPARGWISPPAHYSPIDEPTTVEIQPHTDLLFSVPLNHLGPSWFLRLTFERLLSKVRSGRPTEGTVDFTWAGIPVKERGAWKTDSAK